MVIKIDKKVLAAITITTVILTAIFITGSADGTTPGSEADPVVTQSYVDLKSDQMKYYIDNLVKTSNEEIGALKVQIEQKNQELAKLQKTVTELTTAGSEGFVVAQVPKDKTILAGAGTEIILRSGKATAISGPLGDLANITASKDLKTGDAITINHLLISSRDDGRGLKTTSECYLLIRGKYTIK